MNASASSGVLLMEVINMVFNENKTPKIAANDVIFKTIKDGISFSKETNDSSEIIRNYYLSEHHIDNTEAIRVLKNRKIITSFPISKNQTHQQSGNL